MRRSTIWASVLLVALASACVGARPVPTPRAGRVAPPSPFALASAHPHGPDQVELTRSPGTAWAAATIWPAGGRHPVWRGCQHVYNPALSAFLFGPEPAG